MEYRLLIDIEAIKALDRLPKRVRQQLLDQLDKIRSFPSNYSDYSERDAVGRRVEIWIDSADRHVKVLALKAADK